MISVAVAVRCPAGLKALVISGGFAKNPITSPLLKVLAGLAAYFPGPLYRMTLDAAVPRFSAWRGQVVRH